METEFVLPIDAAKFRSTSDAWNELMLGEPWSVGHLTTLIELKTFKSKEEWEAFYYQSGEERERLLSRWDAPTQAMLQNELLIRTDKDFVHGLSWNLKNLNTQFGRTRERLYQKGEILYSAVHNNGCGLSVEECFECVRFRVVCETWNRVVERERNTIKTLQAMFPHTVFQEVPGEVYHTYAIDYEAYVDGKLRYALQVKPESYTDNTTYLTNARQANSRKNQLYVARFGAPVYEIISDNEGNILHTDVLKNLEQV
ncbi:hypothetical protein DXT99_08525 [Pontibacter diazotrophicus]|uniref:MjaI family restriction endonuclease n=1 Tax=Pontibacter diazotrophicus TaxID=1400979 RepID=A0A3D8LE20_9BACT|nr:hypothetical protein [Pontibacter diazotrophicus]RDV15524.1 hypothetical protein DXT99_08525 [Pontibacter diazotrophicus]